MSELLAYFALGYHHVASPDALDHILFLVALAAIYQWRDWRSALWVVTAFTVGHSITLGLVATDLLHIPSAIIEFLIPLTIIATAIDNLVFHGRRRATMTDAGQAADAEHRRVRYRPVFASVFGLVHGAGFATYLRGLFVDHVVVPLLGFNLGIEAGQIVILLAAIATLAAVDVALRRIARSASLRWRVVSVSSVIGIVAVRWAVERAPW